MLPVWYYWFQHKVRLGASRLAHATQSITSATRAAGSRSLDFAAGRGIENGGVLDVRMMKQQLCQSGEERGRSAVAGGIGDPEQCPPVFDRQPAVNVAANLNDRAVVGSDFPSRQREGLLWNQRLLCELGCGEITL